jgi:hypothetical protein
LSTELIRYDEPLNDSEIGFLIKKRDDERKQYFKILSVLMVLSFIIPFAGAWYRAADGAENAFSIFRYFAFTALLLSLSIFAVWMSYHLYLRKVNWDIKTRTKTIELSHITRKQYMPQNKSYHFYIDSPNRMSIEVSQDDFYHMDEGDEVSIEYTTHAKIFLGYF